MNINRSASFASHLLCLASFPWLMMHGAREVSAQQVENPSTVKQQALFSGGVGIAGGDDSFNIDSLMVEELDGDGALDVLFGAAVTGGVIAWIPNNGSNPCSGLGFRAPVDIASANVVRAVDAALLDNNGTYDVVAAVELDNRLIYFPNDGNGNFGNAEVIDANLIGARAVDTGDFDGQNGADIVAAGVGVVKQTRVNSIVLYTSNGNGGFTPRTVSTLVAGPRDVQAADLDNDGNLDILFSAGLGGDNQVGWFRGNGAGGFNGPRTITTNVSFPLSVFPADLNGDNQLDVVYASRDTRTIAWNENSGDGNFGPQQVVNDNAISAIAVFAEDIDGDGDADIIARSSGQTNQLAWFENRLSSGGGFNEIQIPGSPDNPSAIFSADLDADGDNDIVIGTGNRNESVVFYENFRINDNIPEIEVEEVGGGSIPNGGLVNLGSELENSGNLTVNIRVSNNCRGLLEVSDLSVPAPFSIQNGLGPDIGPFQQDTFTVNISTNNVGTFRETVTLTTNDADESPYTFDVTATIVAREPDIEIASESGVLENNVSIVDFGRTELNEPPVTLSFTIRNRGNEDLIVSDFSLPEEFVSDGISGTISSGESETFTISLPTTDPGVFSGMVIIDSNDPNEDPFNFSIEGEVFTESDAVITVDGIDLENDASIDFGTVFQGGTPPRRTILITNEGTAPLSITRLTQSSPFLIVEALSNSIAPNQSSELVIELPTAQSGEFNRTLTYETNDPNASLINFFLSGDVLPPAPDIVVEIDDAPVSSGDGAIDFGIAPLGSEPPTRSFEITNQGVLPLAFSNLAVPEPFTATNSLPETLDPGENFELSLSLATGMSGDFVEVLTLDNNDPETPNFGITLRGSVTVPAITVTAGDIELTPPTDTLDFGVVRLNTEPAPTRTVSIRNLGRADLSLANLNVPEGFRVLDTLDSPVAPNEEDLLVLELETGTPGNFGGTVSFDTNDPANSTYSFNVTGEVSGQPIIVLSNTTLNACSPVNFQPFPTNFFLSNGNEGNIAFQIEADRTWIDVQPDSGTLNNGEQAMVQVNFPSGFLNEGTWNGSIIVSAQNLETGEEATNSPAEIDVELLLNAPSTLSEFADFLVGKDTSNRNKDLNCDGIVDASDLVFP